MKLLKEKLAGFFEEPARDKLKDIILSDIGELDCMDFKTDWIELSKMAKHILAIANSGGGCIIIGVEETQDGKLLSNGTKELKDKADIMKGIEKYIPSILRIEMADFKYNDESFGMINGKIFQVIFIEDNPEHMPYLSMAEGDGIKKDIMYIRRGTNSVAANYEEIQGMINRRVSTEYSSSSEFKLEEHLSQLKILYNNVSKFNTKMETQFENLGIIVTSALYGKRVKSIENYNYPKEDFDKFIGRMIELKKKKIERIIEVQ